MLDFSPALRRLLIAQLPADFADWLDFVAISAMLAYVWSAPPMAFAMLAFAMGAPAFIIGPLMAGHVDQADLRNVMILSNLGRAIATASLIVAPDWPILVALVALRSAVDSVYTPAKQAGIQAAATEEELLKANQVSQGINQLSKVIAPALGGLLIALLSPGKVFLANACLSLLAALLLIGFPKALRAPADPQGTFAGLRQAVGIIRNRHALRTAVIAMALVIGAIFLFDSLIPPHLKSLGFAQEIVGYTISATGLGTLLGALAPMRDTAAMLRLQMALGALAASGLLVFLGSAGIIGFSLPLVALLAVFFGFGIISARVFVPLRVVMQRETPKEHMARVAALSEAANMAGLLIPPFIGAYIARHSSTGWSFVAAGIAFLVLTPVLWQMARERHRPDTGEDA